MYSNTLAVFSSLLVLCHALGFQGVTTNCENVVVPPESQENLGKQLWEKKMELARLEEKVKGIQNQIDVHKNMYEGQILSLKTNMDLKIEREQVEQNLMSENCNLKLEYMSLNDSSSRPCQKNLQACKIRSSTCGCSFETNSDETEQELGVKSAETPAPTSAPKFHTIQLSRSRQYYISNPGQKKTWNAARKHCETLKMDLASVETEEENRALLQQINQISADKGNFWLSGTNVGTQGPYRWAATGADFGFTFWHKGEPDNHQGKEHCLAFSHYPTDKHEWSDKKCDAVMRFICEKQSEEIADA